MNVRQLKKDLKSLWIKRKQFVLDDSILLISSPRGGSTWLLEILKTMPKSVINWEPFHPKFGVVPEKWNLGPSVYIPENQNNPELTKLIDRILRFKLSSRFTIGFCKLNEIYAAKVVITKSVRATCLLPWLVKSIALKRKPVYLLRHPIATALSHLKAFGQATDEQGNYVIPDSINNERFKMHQKYINGLPSQLERQVALWCIDNLLVINHPDHGKKWVVVYYENLVLNSIESTKEIFAELNIPMTKEMLESIDFKKPSQTDMDNDLLKNTKEQLAKWKRDLSEKQLADLQTVFDYFKLTLYSAYSDLPITNKVLN